MPGNVHSKRAPREPESEASFGLWLSKLRAKEACTGLSVGQRLAFFALLGGVMGTLLDAFHVLNETAYYDNFPKIPLLDVAFYVPIEFATAGVVVGLIRPWLDVELRRKRSELPPAIVLFGMIVLSGAWFGSGWLTAQCWVSQTPQCTSDPSALIATILTFIAGGMWLVFDRSWQGAFAALLTAGIGVTVELGLVELTGTYHYRHPDFWGVPKWLPSLYVVACVAVGNLGRFMKYSWKEEVAAEPAPLKEAA